MKHNNSDVSTEMQAISKIIFGEPASKANSRRLVHFGGMSRLIKSDKALGYADAFKQQWQPEPMLLTGDLRVTMHIYYASRRPDLDESLILDLMQGIAYVNDRQVKERHVYWGLDPESPRSIILIEPIEEVSPKKMPRQKRGKTPAIAG
jgi:Holliday junction resolvase RusA-like endonuclease